MDTRLSQPPFRAQPRCGGWTLPELMISAALGLMILGVVVGTYIYMNRTLNGTMNYEEMDRQSRRALDLMSTDIRQCGGLTNYSTNSLYFTNLDGSQLTYIWDTTNTLTYTNASTSLAGCPRGGILLSGCRYLSFSVFQRNPIAGTTMTFTPATNAALTKVIVMDWICRRTNYITDIDTESVQTTKVVMRN
jgi:hypothetical protein